MILISLGIGSSNLHQGGITPEVLTSRLTRAEQRSQVGQKSNLGPGFWKLNTSFLTELDYVNQIKTTIQETLDEYKNDESVNPSLLWEMIKLKVREKSLRYSKSKTKQAKQRETFLEQTIARLEADLDNKNSDEMHSLHLEEQLNESRLELEKIIEIRTKGAILRSKSKWYN